MRLWLRRVASCFFFISLFVILLLISSNDGGSRRLPCCSLPSAAGGLSERPFADRNYTSISYFSNKEVAMSIEIACFGQSWKQVLKYGASSESVRVFINLKLALSIRYSIEGRVMTTRKKRPSSSNKLLLTLCNLGPPSVAEIVSSLNWSRRALRSGLTCCLYELRLSTDYLLNRAD